MQTIKKDIKITKEDVKNIFIAIVLITIGLLINS
jgi:hypothetical protein